MPSLVPSSIFHGDDVSLCGHRHLVWRTADICCAYFASCCTCSIRTLAVAECSCPFTVVTKWNDIHHYFFKVPWRASQGIPKRKLRQRWTCAASAATSCIQVSSSSRTRVDSRWADVAANSRSDCVVTRVMASRKKCDNVIPLEIYTVNYRLLTSIYWLSIHKSYHLQKPPVRLCISAIPYHQSSIYLFYFLPLVK